MGEWASVDMASTQAVMCRHCATALVADSLPEIIGLYMVHTVRKHWEYVEQLHDVDDSVIAASFAHAYAKGWI
jgi:hypothetical protein